MEEKNIRHMWSDLYFLMDNVKTYMDNIYRNKVGIVQEADIEATIDFLNEKVEEIRHADNN